MSDEMTKSEQESKTLYHVTMALQPPIPPKGDGWWLENEKEIGAGIYLFTWSRKALNLHVQ